VRRVLGIVCWLVGTVALCADEVPVSQLVVQQEMGALEPPQEPSSGQLQRARLEQQMAQVTAALRQLEEQANQAERRQKELEAVQRSVLCRRDKETAQLSQLCNGTDRWMRQEADFAGVQSGMVEAQAGLHQLVCKVQEDSLGDWLAQHSRFTLAGAYARRHLHESAYVTPPAVGFDEQFFGVPGPQSDSARGNWGTAFVAFELVAPRALYAALRGSWGWGQLHPDREVGIALHTFPVDFPNRFWQQTAHEWDVEGRLGYTFELTCNTLLSLYTGAGYHGISFNLIGRSKAVWWQVPVGLRWEWNPSEFWRVGFDGEIGMMANGRFMPWDEPFFHDAARPFDNRYQWQLELPISCGWCLCNGELWLELVPYWHGWKTHEKVVRQGVLTQPLPDANTFAAFPLAAPTLVSSTLGGRLAIEFDF
jgi:hypothetical protein